VRQFLVLFIVLLIATCSDGTVKTHDPFESMCAESIEKIPSGWSSEGREMMERLIIASTEKYCSDGESFTAEMKKQIVNQYEKAKNALLAYEAHVEVGRKKGYVQ
jgi:hypothetical protein